MTCPVCGGVEHRLLAPGWVQCTSSVDLAAVMITSTGREVVRSERARCTHRYQVGTSAVAPPKCWCGVYAIGECTGCGAPVCGLPQHSFHGPELRCGSCQRTAEEGARAVQLAAAAAARAAAAQQESEQQRLVAAKRADAAAASERFRRQESALRELPSAGMDDVLRYLSGGVGQTEPWQWSLRHGVRLEPVALTALPALLIAAGYPPPRGQYPPRLRRLRPDPSLYFWPLEARSAANGAPGHRWQIDIALDGNGRTRDFTTVPSSIRPGPDTAPPAVLHHLAVRRYAD